MTYGMLDKRQCMPQNRGQWQWCRMDANTAAYTAGILMHSPTRYRWEFYLPLKVLGQGEGGGRRWDIDGEGLCTTSTWPNNEIPPARHFSLCIPVQNIQNSPSAYTAQAFKTGLCCVTRVSKVASQTGLLGPRCYYHQSFCIILLKVKQHFTSYSGVGPLAGFTPPFISLLQFSKQQAYEVKLANRQLPITVLY